MPETEVKPTPEPTVDLKPARVRAVQSGMSAADVAAMFDKLVATKGDGKADVLDHKLLIKSLKLTQDLATTQAELNTLKADLATAKDAAKNAIPADHVLLPKADADLLEAYKAFGKPDAIKAAADELKASKESLAVVDKTRTLAAVARVAGVKNVALFNKILDDDIIFAPAKVKDDLGNDVDSFTATVKGPDGKPVTKSIQEMVLADWQPYIAALAVDPASPPASRTVLPIGDTPYRPTNAFTGAPDANENGQPKYVNGNQIREQLAI